MNSDEAFTLSWEEIVDLYSMFLYEDYIDTDIISNLFERLQEALQPRDVVEG
jgi:hypothetical protein